MYLYFIKSISVYIPHPQQSEKNKKNNYTIGICLISSFTALSVSPIWIIIGF